MNRIVAALLVLGLSAFTPASDVGAQSTPRGTSVGFSSSALGNQHAAIDSAATLGITATAVSPRGGTVVLFMLLGAALGTLLALNACSEAGCMTVLPVAYGIVLGAAAGALIGWIISATY